MKVAANSPFGADHEQTGSYPPWTRASLITSCMGIIDVTTNNIGDPRTGHSTRRSRSLSPVLADCVMALGTALLTPCPSARAIVAQYVGPRLPIATTLQT